MMVDTQEEEQLIELARDTAERLETLALRLEAYANVTHDTGERRRSDDTND